ncbi:hypothetical protein HGM15179_018822 [Zosterops borbonicus]|uniref:Uncharacterized protein n=1 Tax=Zosterops borbonicus TaxID=364589 RepID=A0A8K1FYS6_9PASS|nr:hypothetical protein HGM15179_018822 [Zosterops borbonicus]
MEQLDRWAESNKMKFNKSVEDQTATEAESDSTIDLLALVQWKLWERETQGKNRSENIMCGHSDPLMLTALMKR